MGMTEGDLCTEGERKNFIDRYGERLNIHSTLAEVERQRNNMADIVFDTRNSEFQVATDGSLQIHVDGLDGVPHPVTPLAFSNICQFGRVRQEFARRVQEEDPEFLTKILNREFHVNHGQRMGRYLDDHMRFLGSDKYRRFDVLHTLQATLPTIGADNDWRILECSFTERNFHMRVVRENTATEIRVGDTVYAGIDVRTSEVGCGALQISEVVMRAICTNGMVNNGKGLRRVHLGRQADTGFLPSAEALEAEDAMIMLQARDAMKELAEPQSFFDTVNKLKGTAEADLDEPAAATLVLADSFKMNMEEQSSLVSNMMSEGDTTVWGLLNAVTATARDMPDYDRKVELETAAANLGIKGGWGRLTHVTMEDVPKKRLNAA